MTCVDHFREVGRPFRKTARISRTATTTSLTATTTTTYGIADQFREVGGLFSGASPTISKIVDDHFLNSRGLFFMETFDQKWHQATHLREVACPATDRLAAGKLQRSRGARTRGTPA